MVTKLILITGLSGAGKSTTMSILEDLGYHCIDQLPIELMPEFINLLKTTEDHKYDNVALSSTLMQFPEIHEFLEQSHLDFQVIILSAGDQQLVSRYKFTRHTHPLIAEGKAKGLDGAIQLERRILNELPQYANATYLDTGDLTYQDLKKQIDNEFSLTVNHDLSITFESFGYKNGIPQDADFLFDVRILPNPYWVPELRNYSGDDKEVYDYVMENVITKEYLKRLTDFLDFIFSSYEKNGRAHIIIGIGCTGGKHRSVSVVNYLMEHYGKQYACYKESRNISPEGVV